MDALRTVVIFDIVLVRCADSWDIDLTYEDKFNVSSHLRVILFVLSPLQLGPKKNDFLNCWGYKW